MEPINAQESIRDIFTEDIAQRKKTANSVSLNKTIGRKVWFPSDTMSRKDKYNYRKSGKVWCYHMYDNILPLEQFEQLPVEEQKKAILKWREKFSVKELKDTWGWNDYMYYQLIRKLNITTTQRDSNSKKNKATPKVKGTAPRIATISSEVSEPAPYVEMVSKKDLLEVVSQVRQIVEYKEDGLRLTMRGTYDPKAIQDKLLRFAQLIEGEGSMYEIEFTIKEVEGGTSHEG